MSLSQINNLPSTVSQNGTGHLANHSNIHKSLKDVVSKPLGMLMHHDKWKNTLTTDISSVTTSTSAPTFTNPFTCATLDLQNYVSLQGGVPKSMYSGAFWQNQVSGFVNSADPFLISFISDGSHVSLKCVSFGVGDYKIYVDGRPYSELATVHNVAFGSNYHLDVIFTSAKTRHIEIIMGSPAIVSVTFEKVNSVYPGPKPNFKVGVIGDSYVAGAAVTEGTVTGNTISEVIRRATGWEVCNMGIGGTGYCNTGASPDYSGFGSVRRADDVAQAGMNLNMLIVVGSINDYNFTQQQIQDAASAMYSYYASRFPNLPIIVVGAEPVDPNQPAYTKCNDAVKAAALGASNVYGFIDWRGEQWFTYGGKVGATTGTGNTDFYLGPDGTHASQAGNAYLGRRIVSKLAPMTVPVLAN